MLAIPLLLSVVATLLSAASIATAYPLAAAVFPRQQEAPGWSPFQSSTIHPGVQLRTRGLCTANFVYRRGADVFIGQAAHCSAPGSSSQTDGCQASAGDEGVSVNITGASRPGVLAYSSWVRMQRRNESNSDACAYNDFALVRIHADDVWRANPSMPQFGGPTGLRREPLALDERVLGYGNSSLQRGMTWLNPKFGRNVQEQGNGWSHLVMTSPEGIPGDSGGGYIDSEGRAFGVLATLNLETARNGVGDLAKMLDYAGSFDDLAGLVLVQGTEPFSQQRADAGRDRI